ncbi:MAG: hypothetical protein ACE5RC_04815 [Nitrosopumilus sp.]
MTITIQGLEFTGPHYLDHCTLPSSSGIYSIMIETTTNTYSIIYVGETSDFSERLTTSHHKYDCWKPHGVTLHYGLYMMPSSTSEQRTDLESKLISAINPPCND